MRIQKDIGHIIIATAFLWLSCFHIIYCLLCMSCSCIKSSFIWGSCTHVHIEQNQWTSTAPRRTQYIATASNFRITEESYQYQEWDGMFPWDFNSFSNHLPVVSILFLRALADFGFNDATHLITKYWCHVRLISLSLNSLCILSFSQASRWESSILEASRLKLKILETEQLIKRVCHPFLVLVINWIYLPWKFTVINESNLSAVYHYCHGPLSINSGYCIVLWFSKHVLWQHIGHDKILSVLPAFSHW